VGKGPSEFVLRSSVPTDTSDHHAKDSAEIFLCLEVVLLFEAEGSYCLAEDSSALEGGHAILAIVLPEPAFIMMLEIEMLSIVFPVLVESTIHGRQEVERFFKARPAYVMGDHRIKIG
jgi:hypothetical protein